MKLYNLHIRSWMNDKWTYRYSVQKKNIAKGNLSFFSSAIISKVSIRFKKKTLPQDLLLWLYSTLNETYIYGKTEAGWASRVIKICRSSCWRAFLYMLETFGMIAKMISLLMYPNVYKQRNLHINAEIKFCAQLLMCVHEFKKISVTSFITFFGSNILNNLKGIVV